MNTNPKLSEGKLWRQGKGGIRLIINPGYPNSTHHGVLIRITVDIPESLTIYKGRKK
jgi:hypothetical protein